MTMVLLLQDSCARAMLVLRHIEMLIFDQCFMGSSSSSSSSSSRSIVVVLVVV